MNKSHILILSLVIGFLALTISVARAEPNSALKPVPRSDQGGKRRSDELTERVKQNQGKVDLAFIGDSITQGWEGNGAKEVWQKYYGHRKAINLGVGGDRTQHVLWRLEDGGQLEGIHPKVAVVMIGTNNSNGDDNTPGQIADGVAAIVAKLKEKVPGIKILLLGIFPRGENFNNQRGKVLQANQVFQKLGDEKTVFYLDIGHCFVGSDGLISADIMPDYLHLTKRGYEIWAAAIEPTLSAVIGDAPVNP